MSTLPHDPAFPLVSFDKDGALTTPTDGRHHGFTKRERIAMAAMQGLLAGGHYFLSSKLCTMTAEVAGDAVKAADALIAELNRTEGNQK